jgi:COMPASS component SWD3
MSDFESANGTPMPEPPLKRRKVLENNGTSTPRYSSPDELVANDNYNGGSASPTSKHLSATRRISIRRGRPSRSLSRSPSIDELNNAYYSRSDRSSRSRSRSRLRSRSGSRSRLQSRSRSRTRSRSHSVSRTPSGVRVRSGSQSQSQSQSQSRSRSISPTSEGSTPQSHSDKEGAHRRRHRRSSPNQPPPPRKPVQPDFQVQMVLHGHTHGVSQVRISPDGRWIASASADGTVKIWDAASGAHMDTFVGHMAGVNCIAWSPDSDTIASGSDDKAIRLWDRVTGRPKINAKGAMKSGIIKPGRPLLGHHSYVHCVAFSPKGNILASGSYDEAVFLWDVRAGRLMRSLPAHSDPVKGIDFCRDGTLVVSCSTDGLM